MKAPLRFAFGWVLYLAILMGINPIMKLIWHTAHQQPLVVTLATAFVGLALLIALYFGALRRFWQWCDEPRASRPIKPCEE
jgi:uncharacterized membrane-anchored protein